MSNPNPSPATRLKKGGPGKPKGCKHRITRERWEREVSYLAFSNVIQLFGSRRRFTLREIAEMPEEMQRCIASVKVRTENITAGDDKQDQTVEVRLWDKPKALELGARANGWLKDKLEVSAPEELIGRLDRAKLRARGEKA